MRTIAVALLALAALGAQEPATEGVAPQRELRLGKAEGELRGLLSRFEIADREFPWKLEKTRESEKWTEYALTFPSPVKTGVDENDTVPCKYWVPRDGAKLRPAVVVLHWLGGSFEPLEIFSQKLAQRGIAALMLWMPGYGDRRAKDPEKRVRMINLDNDRTAANFRQAVLDVRRAGDWLASRPDVEPSRIGILGISLGAIVGELAGGIDPNFRRLCFLVGGGDLPGIVLHGSRETVKLKERVEELGLTKEKLAEMWRPIEPLTYASRLDRDAVLMINSENDQVFPRASTEKFWEAAGRPEIVWYKADHYTWVLHLPKILDRVERHLKAREPAIRVLLKESVESVEVEIPGECDVRRPEDPEPIARNVAIGRAVARAASGVRVGERDWKEPWIVLAPKDRFQVGGRTYEGTLHLIVSRAGGLHVVNELPLERYVAGVVGPEIGADAPAEALRAQAVCARTFAYAQLLEDARSASRQVFDVSDDVRDQVYAGAPEKGSAVERAVEATAGRVLAFRGKPFKSFFASTCGGATESGAEVFGTDLEPLAGVKCGACGQSKYFSWTLRMEMNGVRDVSVAGLTKSGRVARVRVTKADGTETEVEGPEFRKSVGYDRLRSTNFTVAREGGEFVFRGNGWGHGVGLCQEGAIGLARAGEPWEKILAKYYPSAQIKSVY